VAYEKHTWQSNELVTAEKLNHIEQGITNLAATPFIVSIPTGQWSGTSEDYYITVTASNVTADSILVPTCDHTSEGLLKGSVWCVPAAGSFTIHTSAVPAGTITIMVQFVGTLGEAQYQVLADVYSKSQTDTAIEQSTALHSITDCNNAPMGDSYINASDTTHTPTAIGYYFVHSFNGPTGRHNAQIAIKRNSENVDTYVRNKSSGAWGEWRQVSVI
jgi:hypothetical protein